MTRADWDADRAEEAADISLGSAQVAVKAAGKVMDAMPTPGVRDDPNLQRLISAERGWFARLSPRRSRWPEVAAIDERLEELDRRQQELHDTLADLHQRRQRADADYAAVMYAWMEDGKPDPKPTPLAQDLDAAIAELSAEHGAIDRKRQDILAEKVALVERRRASLVRDAERAVEAAKKRYLAAVDAVEAARTELVTLNETRVWASVFPSEALATYAPRHNLVAGRRRESERHGFGSAVVASAAFGLLRSDAEVFASISTREQAAEMRGISEGALTGTDAMWTGSDEDRERQRRERERLIAAGGNPTVDALALLEALRHGTPLLGSA